VYDTAGNAINASATILPLLSGSSQSQIGFTWPGPFSVVVGTEDIIPIMPPIPDPSAQQ
jgi:hypothetical protein